MGRALEPALIAIECMMFAGAIFFLLTVTRKYEAIEASVNTEVEQKIDVHTTYTDMEEDADLILTGSEVLTEIMMQDGSITIYLSGTNLNNLRVNGMSFFAYMEEYGESALAGKITPSSTYRKEITLNKNTGEISTISYYMV